MIDRYTSCPCNIGLLVLGLAVHAQVPLAAMGTARACVPIHAVVGDRGSGGYRGDTVLLTGIVTASFQGSARLGGFHLQTPDAEVDRDSATSEGIFVRTGKDAPSVAVGDSVRVEGMVSGRGAAARLTGATVTVLGTGRALPLPVELRLPFRSLREPERWEGMRVKVPQTLVVTGNYALSRTGTFVVAPYRIPAPTQVALPGDAARSLRRQDSLAWLAVDDGSSRQDPEVVPYPTGGLSAAHPLRTGTRVSGLEGILERRSGMWTLQPTRAPVFLEDNPRPPPPARTGAVRVASFNVHNYFTTRGAARACGPLRRQACRGVEDADAFRLQKAKILAALDALEADIVGLMEIENHPADSALTDLVKGLDGSTGTWERIATGPLGTDAIKVALIHRKGRVVPVGAPAFLTRRQDPEFSDHLHRVPLAQTYRHSRSGKEFTVVVSHLKSKGSACPGDPDLGDGQGNCNGERTRAARSLARWLQGRPTATASQDQLVIGDFNAYALEDPMTFLAQRGWVNLVSRDEGLNAYSYQFGNAFGTLDHALATPRLAQGARAWHWAINADEPRVSTPGSDAYASSDHDPVVVDLDFSAP